MKKFINVSFKVILRKLFLGEHFAFYDGGIIQPILVFISSLPMLSGIFATLQAAFAKEDALYKLSQASFLTPEIRALHDTRLAYFNFIWDCVNIIKLKNDPSLTLAITRLEFLHHTYAHLPGENYFDMTGTMTNFLQDCTKPENLTAIQLVSAAQFFDLSKIIAEAQTANDAFKTLHHERSMDKVQLAEMGRLSEVRFDVDSVFDAFVDAVNVAWTANEIGAKDPAIRQHLIEVKENIVAAVQEAQIALVRRGRHKIKDDGKNDDETQTPDTTNPAAPDTPNQNPGTGPHPLDPNEHPSMGEH